MVQHAHGPIYFWDMRIRYYLSLALCCGVLVTATAQTFLGDGAVTIISTGRFGSVAPEDATWLESDVDERPAFPGGAEALGRHFADSTGCSWPGMGASCIKQNKVLVWFIVEADGSVLEAWPDRGGCAGLQERAVCTALRMPPWVPGKRKDVPVRTRVRVPVAYEVR